MKSLGESLYPGRRMLGKTTMSDDDRHGRGIELAELTFPGLLEREGASAGALVAHLARVHSALVNERAAAPDLAAELLAETPERSSELARREPRFHTWGLCELLLSRGLAAAELDPPAAGRLAFLTLAVAEHLDLSRHAAAVVADLQARTWGCLVSARLSGGDLAGAEEALRTAASNLACGTGDLLVEGNLLEHEASVRQAQGRLSEAAALLKQAASRYREIGDADLLARAQRKRELTLRASGLSAPARVSFPPNS